MKYSKIFRSTILQSIIYGIVLMVYLSFTYLTPMSDTSLYNITVQAPPIIVALFLVLVLNKEKVQFGIRKLMKKDNVCCLLVRMTAILCIGGASVGLASIVNILFEIKPIYTMPVYFLMRGIYYVHLLLFPIAYAVFEFLLIDITRE